MKKNKFTIQQNQLMYHSFSEKKTKLFINKFVERKLEFKKKTQNRYELAVNG